jgi:hypothetical protein
MPIPRRNFMQLLGISLGSMLLARCQRTATPTPAVITCYTIVPPTDTPGMPAPPRLAAMDRMRLCWLKFGELAQKTLNGVDGAGNADNQLGTQMTADHRSVLDELIAAGEIAPAVADLVQEAYAAAVFHIWRSNVAMTCYLTAGPLYAPAGADDLVRQAETLNQIVEGGAVTPETLAKVQAALEHDFAFYALTDEDMKALYDRMLEEYSDPGESPPTFEELKLTLTEEVRAAAEFLIDVLMG